MLFRSVSQSRYEVVMARLPRLVVPGYPHHLTQRGVRSLDVFTSDNDRISYLAFIAEECKRHGVEILAWCLMTNMFTLLLYPRRSRRWHVHSARRIADIPE